MSQKQFLIDFENSMKGLAGINQNIQNTIREKNRFNQKLSERLQRINEMIKELAAKIYSLKNKVDELQGEVNTNTSSVTNKDKEIADLQARINNLESEKTNLTNQLAAFQENINRERVEKQQAIDVCEEKLRALTQDNTRLQNETNVLRNDLNSRGDVQAQHAEQIRALSEESRQQLEQSQRENEQALAQLRQEHEQQLQQLREQNARDMNLVTQNIDRVEGERDELARQITQIQEEHRRQIEQLEQQHRQQLEEQLQQLREQKAREMAENINRVEGERDNLARQLAEANERVNATSGNIDEINNKCKADIDKLTEEIAQLKKENEGLVQRIIAATQAITLATENLRLLSDTPPNPRTEAEVDHLFDEIQSSIQGISNAIQGNSNEAYRNNRSNSIPKIRVADESGNIRTIDLQKLNSVLNQTLNDARNEGDAAKIKKLEDAIQVFKNNTGEGKNPQTIADFLNANYFRFYNHSNKVLVGGKKRANKKTKKVKLQKGGFTYKNVKRRSIPTSSRSVRSSQVMSNMSMSDMGRGRSKRSGRSKK